MNIFDEYGLVRKQIEELERKRRELEPQVIEAMGDTKSGQTKYGGLTVREVKKYDYPLETEKAIETLMFEIANRQAEIKEKKKEAEKTAPFTTTKSLSFSLNKYE